MEIDRETRKRWNIEMALALIRALFDKGEIQEKTYRAIIKDAQTKIADKEEI